MKKTTIVLALLLINFQANADVIPIGRENNRLYYRVGGSSDFALPPVSDNTTIRLDTDTDLGMGNICSSLNPALSIVNSINNLKDSADNLEQSVVVSATGAIIQLPMYLLAQANPTAYNLINNALLSAHKQLDVSVKSCETMKDQISRGQNPYQDWGTVSLNHQWKRHLSLVSSGNEDINYSKKEIDKQGGDYGVPWTQGKKSLDGSILAGGKGQPPIHVISDTVKSGYNALLNRDLRSDENAPDTAVNAGVKKFFPNPKSAMEWITNVIGDQVITTGTGEDCKKAQGSIVGHGLVPSVTSCLLNKEDCVDTVREELGKLVTGNDPVTQESLQKVSAQGIAISPDVIASIRNMDNSQQIMIINKLAQEIAIQRVIDKAFVAKNILLAGAQVPVISSNHPAQVIINQGITKLDNEIRSLAFESQIRKQTMSDTLSEVLKYSNQQQQSMINRAPVSSSSNMMEGGAVVVREKSQ